jgi:hypothetical protein
VIGEVFVPKAQTQDPLHRKLPCRVLDPFGVPVIAEAAREALDDSRPALGLGQQHCSAIGTDRPTVETGHDLAPTTAFESHLALGTLCHRRPPSFVSRDSFDQALLRTRRRRVTSLVVRDPG